MIVPALRLRFPRDISDDERDLLAASVFEVGPAAVHEIHDCEWRVFFRTRDERDAAAGAAVWGRASVSPFDVADEDWARRSQEGLRAIAVGSIVIAPPWDVAQAPGDPGARDLTAPVERAFSALDAATTILEPSMGFGTGHHATTRLCLRALQALPVAGSTVLDVGTGSGVLAIAAAVLGASRVTAIDNDPDAVEAARSNAARNGVPIDLRLADLSSELPRSDLVLANLTGDVLRRHASRLAALTRPGGHLVMSGILSAEANAIRDAFASISSVIDREDETEWASFTVTIP